MLDAAGAGWSVPADDAARHQDAADAARGVEVEERHGGGVFAYTFPIFSGPDVAGTIQYLHSGAAEPDAVRRQLRISARTIGALVEAAARMRSLETVGAAQDREAILAAALEAAGAAAGLLEIREDRERRTEQPAGHESAARLRQLAAKAAGVFVLQESGTGWEAALPLLAGGCETGVLALAFALPHRLGEKDRAFLPALASACAQAVERVRLRERLAAEERLRDEIVDALPVSIAMCTGPRHVLEFSNPQRLRLWSGRNPLGTPLAEGYPELPGLAAAADRVYATGERFRMQATPVRIANGTGEAEERFFDIDLLARRSPEGEVCGVMAFGIEVTPQVQTRLELEREHAFMEAVLDQMPSGVIMAEAPTGRIVLVNNEGERLLRQAVARVCTLEEYRVFHAEHPDGRPYETHEFPLVRSLTSGETVHQEDMIYRRGDGSVAVLAINAAPIRDAAGRIIAAVCTFHDITERRKERDALRRQARLLNLSHDAIITLTAERMVTAWNTGAEETYGWTAAEAGGKLVHRLLRTAGFEEIDAVLLRYGRWEGELRHTRKDGSEIVLESCQALVRDDRGRPAAILEINRDITARKQAEEALRESEQWLRYCQQVTGVGIGDFDLVSGRRKCSGQLYRLYGFEPGDAAFTYETWLERIHPDDREPVLQRLEAARGGGDPLRGRIPRGAARYARAVGGCEGDALFRRRAAGAVDCGGAGYHRAQALRTGPLQRPETGKCGDAGGRHRSRFQ